MVPRTNIKVTRQILVPLTDRGGEAGGYGIVPHMMRMRLVDPESGGGEPRALDEGGRSR